MFGDGIEIYIIHLCPAGWSFIHHAISQKFTIHTSYKAWPPVDDDRERRGEDSMKNVFQAFLAAFFIGMGLSLSVGFGLPAAVTEREVGACLPFYYEGLYNTQRRNHVIISTAQRASF